MHLFKNNMTYEIDLKKYNDNMNTVVKIPSDQAIYFVVNIILYLKT